MRLFCVRGVTRSDRARLESSKKRDPRKGSFVSSLFFFWEFLMRRPGGAVQRAIGSFSCGKLTRKFARQIVATSRQFIATFCALKLVYRKCRDKLSHSGGASIDLPHTRFRAGKKLSTTPREYNADIFGFLSWKGVVFSRRSHLYVMRRESLS